MSSTGCVWSPSSSSSSSNSFPSTSSSSFPGLPSVPQRDASRADCSLSCASATTDRTQSSRSASTSRDSRSSASLTLTHSRSPLTTDLAISSICATSRASIALPMEAEAVTGVSMASSFAAVSAMRSSSLLPGTGGR